MAPPSRSNPYRSARAVAGDAAGTSESRGDSGRKLAAATGAVVLLAAAAVASFGYPGWLLADGKRTQGSPAGMTTASPDNGRTAQGTAASAVAALNSGKITSFRALTCTKNREKIDRTVRQYDPRLTSSGDRDVEQINVTYALTGVATLTRDRARARISENFTDLPRNYAKIIPQNRFDATVDLTRSSGRWQLCDITFTIPGAPSGTAETATPPSG